MYLPLQFLFLAQDHELLDFFQSSSLDYHQQSCPLALHHFGASNSFSDHFEMYPYSTICIDLFLLWRSLHHILDHGSCLTNAGSRAGDGICSGRSHSEIIKNDFSENNVFVFEINKKWSATVEETQYRAVKNIEKINKLLTSAQSHRLRVRTARKFLIYPHETKNLRN